MQVSQDTPQPMTFSVNTLVSYGTGSRHQGNYTKFNKAVAVFNCYAKSQLYRTVTIHETSDAMNFYCWPISKSTDDWRVGESKTGLWVDFLRM